MRLVEHAVVADHFRLVRRLGAGGMGEVWLATHVRLDVPCAVKFILAGATIDEDLTARFEREAKSAARLRSPHVVQILDYGVCAGSPYIAMEYLEGEDLAARLARCGRLTADETISIVRQVARALGKAHAQGIVHRDLKPENVFLTRDEDEEVVKILDFGIAKLGTATSGSHRTKPGSLLGTPGYMSPEQAQALPVDYRSDLWSLAVLAFECLTGRLPFVGDTLGGLLTQIIAGPIPNPTEVAPELPLALDAWWARAASRDREHRYTSARALAQGLADIFDPANAEPLSAPGVARVAPTVPAGPVLEGSSFASLGATTQSTFGRRTLPAGRRARTRRRRFVALGAALSAAILALVAFAVRPAERMALASSASLSSLTATSLALDAKSRASAPEIPPAGAAPVEPSALQGEPAPRPSAVVTPPRIGSAPAAARVTQSGARTPISTAAPRAPKPALRPLARPPAAPVRSAPATPARAPAPSTRFRRKAPA